VGVGVPACPVGTPPLPCWFPAEAVGDGLTRPQSFLRAGCCPQRKRPRRSRARASRSQPTKIDKFENLTPGAGLRPR
jgi:hypothetical protein